MRKFLLTLVVLVAGAMSAWAQNVAQIGSNFYTTLAEAVSAAENNATITVLSDVTLDATLVVPAGKTITLDLNGKTISQEKVCTASYEMILNKGNLTITGNGTISFKDTSDGDPSFGWGSYTLRNEGTLVVENGTIEHLGEQPFATHMICAIFQYSGSTTINGGTISTPNYRSVRLWKGDMTINGGTFEGQVWVQSVDDSSVLTVNGGTFAPRGGDGSSVFVGNVTSSEVHHTVGFSVTGGTFTTKIGCSDAEKLEGDLITGGNFSEAAISNTSLSLFADDIVFDDPVDGYCNAWSPTKVLYINDLAGFLAFRDAVNGGNSFAGMTVNLNAEEIDLRSLDWSESIGKDPEHPFEGIFNGQGNKIKYLKTYSDEFVLSRNYTGLFGVISGNAVIKNLVLENVSITLTCEGQYVGAVVAYANTENGSIENVKIIVDGEIPFLRVNASDVAGVGAIVGYHDQSGSLKISGCEVKGKDEKIGTIIGAEYVGGLIGYASSGAVIDGNTAANLTVTGTEYVGGLIGYASSGAVINGNVVEYLDVQGKNSVGAIVGIMLEGAKATGNTISNVHVAATDNAKSSSVIAGTIKGKVTIDENNAMEGDVKVNGVTAESAVSTAAKVGDVYYPTLKDAATDGEGEAIEVKLFGEDYVLTELESYEHTKAATVSGNLTYTRGLSAGLWHPVYLPFDYVLEANKYKIAEFYDAEDRTLILRMVEEGETLKANTPYAIQPIDGVSSLDIRLTDSFFLEAATVNKFQVGDFWVLGNNKKLLGSDLQGVLDEELKDVLAPGIKVTPRVVGTGGSWGKLKDGSTLKPFRLILAVPEVKNGEPAAQAISMRILSGTTVVEEVVLDDQEDEVIYDLMGRRVETMTKGGIYIVNGKKMVY